MNKIRPILLVWMAIISLAVNAQQNIERLLPTFAGLNDIDVTESIERGTWSQYEEPFYSVLIQNAHIDKIPTSLVDSLIVAFERELPLATESDRYQKHSEQGLQWHDPSCRQSFPSQCDEPSLQPKHQSCGGT